MQYSRRISTFKRTKPHRRAYIVVKVVLIRVHTYTRTHYMYLYGPEITCRSEWVVAVQRRLGGGNGFTGNRYIILYSPRVCVCVCTGTCIGCSGLRFSLWWIVHLGRLKRRHTFYIILYPFPDIMWEREQDDWYA